MTYRTCKCHNTEKPSNFPKIVLMLITVVYLSIMFGMVIDVTRKNNYEAVRTIQQD